ncbi:MAG: DUF1684 domain-containing protein [Cloacibacterium sp.]|nr:DUF1684 domain-containing protein [Cloacibacterium sp.]
MKPLATSLLLLCFCLFFGQKKNKNSFEIAEIKKFQQELNAEYKNPKKSPLSQKEREQFKGHHFFPINLKYRVKAKFVRTPNQPSFEIPTSSGKTKTYEKYGELHFELDEKDCKLSVYQNLITRQTEEYKDYLFLPFLDLTNGVTSYGAGRYIDFRIPEAEEVILDFNKAYNPFCAYSPNYNCPIVPMENFLDLEIRAGIQYIETKK